METLPKDDVDYEPSKMQQALKCYVEAFLERTSSIGSLQMFKVDVYLGYFYMVIVCMACDDDVTGGGRFRISHRVPKRVKVFEEAAQTRSFSANIDCARAKTMLMERRKQLLLGWHRFEKV